MRYRYDEFVDGENRYKRRLVESKSVGLITSRLHIEGLL